LCFVFSQISFDRAEPERESKVGRYQFFAHPTSGSFYGFIDTREGLVLMMEASGEDTALAVIELKYLFWATYKDYLKEGGADSIQIEEQLERFY
jgi:hypothetical protein